MELFCSLLQRHSELYHYHLLWIHGPYKYIWSEVWTCYFLKEMLCVFLGLPSFASFWICSTGWYLLSYFCLSLSHKADELRQSLVCWSFSLSSTRLWSHLYCFCDRATRITLYDIVFVQQAGGIFWKLPLCQICRKEQQVVHGSEKKTQLKWLIFPQHLSG